MVSAKVYNLVGKGALLTWIKFLTKAKNIVSIVNLKNPFFTYKPSFYQPQSDQCHFEGYFIALSTLAINMPFLLRKINLTFISLAVIL